MNVNLLAGAALLVALAMAPANAASILVTPTLRAVIQGHEVESRFLPGAFIDVPDGWSGGSPAIARAADPISAGSGDVPFTDDTDRSIPNTDQPGAATHSNVQPGLEDMAGSGGGSSPDVGTVPLPPALPMFGAALLALLRLGVVRRRRGRAGGQTGRREVRHP